MFKQLARRCVLCACRVWYTSNTQRFEGGERGGRKIIFNYNERVLNTAPHHIFSLSTVVLVCTYIVLARSSNGVWTWTPSVVVCLILHIIFSPLPRPPSPVVLIKKDGNLNENKQQLCSSLKVNVVVIVVVSLHFFYFGLALPLPSHALSFCRRCRRRRLNNGKVAHTKNIQSILHDIAAMQQKRATKMDNFFLPTHARWAVCCCRFHFHHFTRYSARCHQQLFDERAREKLAQFDRTVD